MARLTILAQEEIDTLYAIPSLDDEERSFLFGLDEVDRAILDSLENDTARKVDYILQLGYYRAIGTFFLFSFQKVKADVDFILQQYFPGEPFPKKQLSKNTHYQNRCAVMNQFGLRDADARFQGQLLKEAKALAKRHVLSRFVLEELLSYCQLQNVVRPAYSSLQDIVSIALREERKRLATKLYTDANKSLRGQLDRLLDNDKLFYNLTLLKKDQKDFSTTEIKKSVDKQQLVIGIYRESQLLMPKLGISEQNIIYYANLAEFYSIQKLRRFADKNLVRLYLLCYAHHRFLKINDHLVTSLIQKMTKYADGADYYQRSKIELMEDVDTQLRKQAFQVMAINIDDRIPDNQVRAKAFEVVQGSLNRGESYHQLSSTIAKVSGGRMLSGKTEIELDINADSIRLIANAVIFYNATLLSALYQYYQSVDPEMAKEILRFSPVAWQHINFIGKYEFYNRGDMLNIQEVIKNFTDVFKIDISPVSRM